MLCDVIYWIKITTSYQCEARNGIDEGWCSWWLSFCSRLEISHVLTNKMCNLLFVWLIQCRCLAIIVFDYDYILCIAKIARINLIKSTAKHSCTQTQPLILYWLCVMYLIVGVRELFCLPPLSMMWHTRDHIDDAWKHHHIFFLIPMIMVWIVNWDSIVTN